MFKAVGNYVWLTSPDGTDSVVAVTMGHVSAESIAAGLNLLKEKDRRDQIDSLRQAMREDVAQLRKIIHRQPQEVS
jgi:hypothetical protein